MTDRLMLMNKIVYFDDTERRAATFILVVPCKVIKRQIKLSLRYRPYSTLHSVHFGLDISRFSLL